MEGRKGVECKKCGKNSNLISQNIGYCLDCIRKFPDEILPRIKRLHIKTREAFRLPIEPPRNPEGLKCRICINECQIGEGERGYCGLRINKEEELINLAGTREGAVVEWYYDLLPTNCVADWVCHGSKEIGYSNLAVFYGACTYNCLFCQNWHYRKALINANLETNKRESRKTRSAQELAEAVNERVACICYFGGDPTPQLAHALEASKLALEKKNLRICFETNGSMNPELLKKAAKLSLESGGCIKFDLKAWDENLHITLTSVSNRQTLENFVSLSKLIKKRPKPPFLIASTLLVPGYIDEKEVRNIANFIAKLNPDIPYSLLGFYPHFYMKDLPTTSREHADRCREVALGAGLKNVRIGNPHLLSEEYN